MREKKGKYPQKYGINLVIKERGSFHPGRVIPMVLAVVLAAAAFGKFAVADRLAQVNRAQAALSATEATQQRLLGETVDYEAVRDEYSRYSSGWMNEEEAALVERMDVLNLVERELMSAAGIRHFQVAGALLTVDLTGISLSDTSRIVERLYNYPIVSQVEVFNASTGENAMVSLVVTLSGDTEGGAS